MLATELINAECTMHLRRGHVAELDRDCVSRVRGSVREIDVTSIPSYAYTY